MAVKSRLPGDDSAEVSDFERELEYRSWKSANSAPEDRLDEYRRTSECLYGPAASRPCPQRDPAAPPLSLTCDEGAPVEPLWLRTRDSTEVEFDDGWSLRLNWLCPEDLLPPFTQEDLRRLKIEALEVNQQPETGPILVQKPTIVFAEPEDRELRAVLFGTYGVDVVVTPVEYTWDFGDGATLTTADPGRPYPAFDVTHVYTSLADREITLTTTWTGKYRVDDDPLHRWREVDGTAVTVHTGEPFEVVSLRTRLSDG